MKTNINLKLMAPLSHFGDERLGTMQIARTMKFLYEGEFIDVPVYTGNAFRGILRRIAMKDFLEKISISEEGISAKLYHLLFTGGALTAGSRYTEVGEKRKMRTLCPPLALFGSAIGSQIPEGKLKVGIFKPVCKELEDFTGIKSNISIFDMLEENFYTRKDDLKSKDYNITDETTNDNAVQMKYEQQNLSAGTNLVSTIILENDTDIEASCLKAILNKFDEMPFIGGKSAVGHGEVKMSNNLDADINLYYSYLEENKEEIRTYIRELEANL